MRFQFGQFEVRPTSHQLLVNGVPAILGARAFELLVCLIRNRDRLVSKDELFAAVWPGLVVTVNNLTVQVSSLRKLLGPSALITVSGRGYRFGLPVTELDSGEPYSASTMPDLSGPDDLARRRSDGVVLTLPNLPSIAVLPFVNISGDAQQDYFCDGITEDITTELSRFRTLFVISRHSTFAYKGRSMDVRHVSRDLGVRYVLEGSARRYANRVRITAQLIDAVNGSHLWAEKYDRVVEDVFDVQQDVTQSIVGMIAPQIHATEQNLARSLRPGNLSAHHLAMRANANSIEALRRSDSQLWQMALSEARQALALDPASALALNVIAEMQARYVSTPQFDEQDLTVPWKEAMTAAGMAIDLDPASSPAYRWLGFLLVLGEFYDEGLANAQRGVELNHNDAIAWSNLACVEVIACLPEKALEHQARAIRLSPRDPNRYIFNGARAVACFQLKDYAPGLAYAQAAVAEAPHAAVAQMSLVLVAAGAGELAVAQKAFETLRDISPPYAHRAVSDATPFRSPEQRRRFTLASRIAAGLEEPGALKSLD